MMARLVFSCLLLFPLAPAQGDPTPPETKAVPRVQVLPLPGHQAAFVLDGRELIRYRFDPASKRPFWHPVRTALAPSLVRMGHPHDPVGHRHHYGVWITHSAVSGVNFWDDEPDNGRDRVRGSIRHQRILGFWDGDESAAMMTLNHWVADRDNRVLLIEKRHIELRPAPDATSWVMVVDSEFVAPKGAAATFEPSGFGLFSVRMAKTIGVHDGGGRILNSEGQVNEKEVFRKSAKWCDYSGRVTNATDGLAGILLMNHPQNPNHPTAFHVRDDGWMCSCLSLEKPVEVDDRTPLRARWGLWVHQGVPGAARCEEMWRRFADSPPPDVNKKP